MQNTLFVSTSEENNIGTEDLSDDNYYHFYCSAMRYLSKLEENWKLGKYQLKKIPIGDRDFVVWLTIKSNRIISCLTSRQIKVWDKITLECILTISYDDKALSPHAVNLNIVIASFGESKLKVWDLKTGKKTFGFPWTQKLL